MNALEVRHLRKSFATGDQAQVVLRDISFDVRPGELVGLFGPSGCGKSTLLRILTGVIPFDAGEIRLFGSAGERRGLMAYVPQRGGLLGWKTLRENATLGWKLMRGDPTPEIHGRADALLESFGLTSAAHRYPPQASGGERQRAAFIRALLTPAKVVVLDEPVAAIDHITRVHLYEKLLSLVEEADSTLTVLMVSHDPEELLTLCDRVLVMGKDTGSIIAEVAVPFPRPRDPELKFTPEFVGLKRKLWQLLL